MEDAIFILVPVVIIIAAGLFIGYINRYNFQPPAMFITLTESVYLAWAVDYVYFSPNNVWQQVIVGEITWCALVPLVYIYCLLCRRFFWPESKFVISYQGGFQHETTPPLR